MKSGWQTKKLGEVCLIKPPKNEARTKLSGSDFVSFVPMESLGIGKKYFDAPQTRTLDEVAGSYTYFADGDVLLAKITPCFENGKLGIARNLKNGVGFGSSEYIVFRGADALHSEFLYYFLSRETFREEGAKRMMGAVGHKRVAKEFIENTIIPIPPLPEQQRIVAILDKAFEGIATAKANAEKNLTNARELFESYLQGVFANPGDGWEEKKLGEVYDVRDGTHDSPKYHSTGYPLITSKNLMRDGLNFENVRLISKEDYQKINARSLVQKGDVLFAMIGTIGNPTIVTSEPNFAIKNVALFKLNPSQSSNFLKYYLDSQMVISKMVVEAKGTTQKFVGLGYLRDFPIDLPPLPEQKSIVAKLDALSTETKRLEAIYREKLVALEELKQSILQKAFAGELTGSIDATNVIPFPKTIPGITTTDLHAGILAIAYQLHEPNPKHAKTFGHVKAEKIAHMVEAHAGIDLGRNPVQDAAGPNDFPHLQKVESRARKAGYFDFVKDHKGGYSFVKRRRFNDIIERAKRAMGKDYEAVKKILERMLPMDSQQAEIFATVYAAWNNLLIRNEDLSDDAIVFEARENWHENKLEIPRQRFFDAITWMREQHIVPCGKGKPVEKRPSHERS